MRRVCAQFFLLILLIAPALMLFHPSWGKTYFYLAAAVSLLLCWRFTDRGEMGSAWGWLGGIAVFLSYRWVWIRLNPVPSDVDLHNIYFSYRDTSLSLLYGLPMLIMAMGAGKYLSEWARHSVWRLRYGMYLASWLASSSMLIAYFSLGPGPMPRATLGGNIATIGAYMLAILDMLALCVLRREPDQRLKWMGLLLSVPLQLIALLSTGTRAAVLVYLLLLVVISFTEVARFGGRKLLFLGASFLGLLVLVGSFWAPRLLEGVSDVQRYAKGDGVSSLGIRFSLWQAGAGVTLTHPFGESIQGRSEQIAADVASGQANVAALEMKSVHLHNELIEIASLLGIQGLLLWGLLLFSLWRLSIRAGAWGKETMQYYLAMIVLFGLSDVLLFSREFVMFFILVPTLILVLSPALSSQRMQPAFFLNNTSRS